MGDPAGAVPMGAASGTVTVNGASQTGDTLNITAGSSSVTNFFRAGDYIQLGTGSTARLHKVLNNTNTTSGSAALDIWPDIRTSPASGASVIYTNPVGRWRLSENQTTWDINDATFYGISFNCEEAA